MVTDSRGQPVRDLKQVDFTVLDNSSPQQIAFFSAIGNGGVVSGTARPGLGTYTNIPTAQGAPRGVTVLLFDCLNSGWPQNAYALERVRAFLRGIEPEDHIGIYVLRDDLKLVHSISADSSDLVAAIHRYDRRSSPIAGKGSVHVEETTGDKDLDRFLSGQYVWGYKKEWQRLSGAITVASFDAIARQLGAFPGRKSLIWVTTRAGVMAYLNGDSIDQFLAPWHSVAAGDLADMIRMMNTAGISVYTVDARGLETERASLSGLIIPKPNSALIEIAQRTGGRAFFNRNDLETGIRRALEDSRFTYSIAYAPDHNKWKGEWRKIEVKVDRPGVTVLARSGYFALPDPRPIPPKGRFEFLSQIAASPIDSTQLPLTVRLATSRQTTTSQIGVTAQISPQALGSMLATRVDGGCNGRFELMFMQIGMKNKLLDATQKQVNADLTPQECSQYSRQGWNLAVRLAIKPGAARLCVILHDENSDAVGSIHIPLTGPESALNVR